jgi:hypothetical protein
MKNQLNCILCLLLAATTTFAQNGIYEGSGTVPANTTAIVTNNFVLGAPVNINNEQGTFILLNTTSERINLVSQGYIRLGDLNQQGTFPAWFEIDATGGTLHGYAKTDMLFQTDSFFYSLHQGGLQLPDNVYSAPAYLPSDRGSIYFNRQNKRLFYFDGDQHVEIAVTSGNFVNYTTMTASGSIGLASTDIIYANPTSSDMIITLPPTQFFDRRVIKIKNTSAFSVNVSPAAGNSLEGGSGIYSLAASKCIELQATGTGWYIISSF